LHGVVHRSSFTLIVTAVNNPPSVTPPAVYVAPSHIGINSTIIDVDGAGAQPFSIT